MDYIQANTNGRLHDAREVSLSPLDRGFLYGDAIYEVWRTFENVLFGAREHWDRLMRSAGAIHLTLPFSFDGLFAELTRTALAFRSQTGWEGELYLRLQVTRGEGPISIDTSAARNPTFIIFVRALRPPPAPGTEKPLKLTVVQTLHRNSPETLNPLWKTGNYLNNLLCFHEGRSRGADEVVITNLAGEIAEAALCNLAFADGDKLVTPPLSAGMLDGITRNQLIHAVAPCAGVPVEEIPIRPEELGRFSEAFLLSTTRDIAPVSAIDAFTYKTGPGTLGRKLKEAFNEFHRSYAAMHPEYRLG